MEDRAKFVLVGLFTFAVIAGAFGFVYWLHATSGANESTSYRVIFSGSVTGLRVGAPVLFNGIRVGEVSDLRLTDNPAARMTAQEIVERLQRAGAGAFLKERLETRGL